MLLTIPHEIYDQKKHENSLNVDFVFLISSLQFPGRTCHVVEVVNKNPVPGRSARSNV